VAAAADAAAGSDGVALKVLNRATLPLSRERRELILTERPRPSRPRQCLPTRPVSIFLPATTQASKELSLNFRDMPLDDVLSFLSRQGGFTIHQAGTDGRAHHACERSSGFRRNRRSRF